jgi:hypothetical protein
MYVYLYFTYRNSVFVIITFGWFQQEPRGWPQWGAERFERHLHWLNSSDPAGRERSNLENAHQYGLSFDGLCMDGTDLAVTDGNVKWYILFKLHRRFFGVTIMCGTTIEHMSKTCLNTS